jgi:hypothetical protein
MDTLVMYQKVQTVGYAVAYEMAMSTPFLSATHRIPRQKAWRTTPSCLRSASGSDT